MLASRSSLELIKIKRIGFLTAFQTVNFLFWGFNAYFFFWKNYYVMFVWMVFVGLMSGAVYVNTMYMIIHSNVLKKKEKELTVVILLLFNDIGVLSASLFSLLMTNTLMKF